MVREPDTFEIIVDIVCIVIILCSLATIYYVSLIQKRRERKSRLIKRTYKYVSRR
jgi:uncharacterized membrane protein YwzB